MSSQDAAPERPVLTAEEREALARFAALAHQTRTTLQQSASPSASGPLPEDLERLLQQLNGRTGAR